MGTPRCIPEFPSSGQRDLSGQSNPEGPRGPQASALLQTSRLKPTLWRVALSGIADEMSVYEIP